MAADLEQATAAEAAAVADMRRARAAEAARSQQLAEAEEQLLQVSWQCCSGKADCSTRTVRIIQHNAQSQLPCAHACRKCASDASFVRATSCHACHLVCFTSCVDATWSCFLSFVLQCRQQLEQCFPRLQAALAEHKQLDQQRKSRESATAAADAEQQVRCSCRCVSVMLLPAYTTWTHAVVCKSPACCVNFFYNALRCQSRSNFALSQKQLAPAPSAYRLCHCCCCLLCCWHFICSERWLLSSASTRRCSLKHRTR
jgi:hypothetical protein